MSDLSNDPELKAYYREAGSWAGDRSADNLRSRKVAWIIAAIATFVALLEAIALAGLVPLKTVVPMAVLVDRETGYVTTVDPAKATQITPDSALTRSMLAQYVTARETIDRASVAQDYRKIVLWSGGSARQSYLAQMKPGNPANPFTGRPANAVTQIAIRSVSTLDDGSALIRFDLVDQGTPGNTVASRPYVAVLRYRYRQRALSEADRFINPLGFEVTSYRRDAEAPPPVVIAPVAVDANGAEVVASQPARP